jgi:hypothetical protein
LVTVFSFYMLTTTIGNIIGGVGRLVGGTLRTVGATAATGVMAAASGNESGQGQGMNLDNLKGQISQLLSQTGQPGLQPDALGNRTEKAVDRIIANPQSADDVIRQFFGSGGPGGQIDREAMVNLIAARTGKSRQEAGQIADNWVASYNQAQQQWEQTRVQAEQQAREAADTAARALSIASILAFVGLVLGAVVSGFAAKKGRDSAELVMVHHGTGSAMAHNPQARY